MSWKWICGKEQAANGLRFATKQECDDYGFNLAMRWFAMPSPALSIECADAVNTYPEDKEQVFKPAGHRVKL